MGKKNNMENNHICNAITIIFIDDIFCVLFILDVKVIVAYSLLKKKERERIY